MFPAKVVTGDENIYKWLVHFSGKITHSILSYLESQCVDLEALYELTPLPSERLRDPTCWQDAKLVETFLDSVRSQMHDLEPGENLMEKAGHAEIDSWGLLNSVLKMIPHPQDIFTRPQKILSHFICPSPSFEVLEDKPLRIVLAISLKKELYPNSMEYLRAALESLPRFMGRPFATVEWKGSRLTIDWGPEQEALLSEVEDVQSIKPELMKTLVSTIEDAQRDVEQKAEQINLKEQEIKSLKSQILRMSESQIQAFESSTNLKEDGEAISAIVEPSLLNVHNQFMKLSDYFTRSQQIVTLMSGLKGVNSKQVASLKKRLDWEGMRQNFTGVVQDGVNNLENVKRILEEFFKDTGFDFSNSTGENKKILVNLDRVVENSISKFTSQSLEKGFNIDRMLFFDRSILINPKKLDSLLCSVFSKVSLGATERLRVVTRVHGKFAEIEVARKGQDTIDVSEIQNDTSIQSIIKEHSGHMKFFPTSKNGASVIIDLPT